MLVTTLGLAGACEAEGFISPGAPSGHNLMTTGSAGKAVAAKESVTRREEIMSFTSAVWRHRRSPLKKEALEAAYIDIRRELCAEFIHERRIHKFILIGNVERDDFFRIDDFRKAHLEALQVRFLHNKDEVRPLQMTFGDMDSRGWLCARGSGIVSAMALEETFRGQASDFVAAANEEKLLA